jgi:PHP family Zn ribbon phosphoesterase
LSEILSVLLGSSVASRKVWQEYQKLVTNFNSEFNVLLETKKEELIKITDEKIADAIIKVREGKIKIKPGYDGVYGEPILTNNVTEEKELSGPKQEGLNKFF